MNCPKCEEKGKTIAMGKFSYETRGGGRWICPECGYSERIEHGEGETPTSVMGQALDYAKKKVTEWIK